MNCTVLPNPLKHRTVSFTVISTHHRHPNGMKEGLKKNNILRRYLMVWVMRFESPENRNRWDSPLFVVLPEDELPCQQIYDALYDRKAPPPNKHFSQFLVRREM